MVSMLRALGQQAGRLEPQAVALLILQTLGIGWFQRKNFFIITKLDIIRRAEEIFRNPYATPEQLEWAINVHPEGIDVVVPYEKALNNPRWTAARPENKDYRRSKWIK